MSFFSAYYKATFEDAKKTCGNKENRAQLVTIKNEATQLVVTALLNDIVSSSYKPPNVWIGLQKTDWWSDFEWVDQGKHPSWKMYEHWAKNEPSGGYGEDCVEMYVNLNSGGQWNDAQCDQKLAFICQKRKFSKI